MKLLHTALAGLLALLTASSAVAQQFPTIPSQSVIGRLGVAGSSGPSQAIPLTTLQANLSGAQLANTVNAGPASGVATFATFRALVGADLPNPGAASKGGVQSLTCASSNWFNTLSTGGALGCSQPNFTDIAGTIAGAQIGTGVITSTMILDGTILNADINASAAIALSKLATQAATTIVGNATGGAAVPTALTAGQVGGLLCVPSRSVFTSGTSLTYTTPSCNSVTATWLEVEVQGGGGGGGGSGTGSTSGAGTTGNASSFGALTAGGGVNGPANSSLAGGAGGTCSGSLGTQQNFPGTAGGYSTNLAAAAQPGAPGGVSFYGGQGVGATAAAGGAAPVNSGGGGPGGGGSTTAGVFNGAGGGSGCHISTIITSPAATYTYTVGGTAAAGTAGTSGFLGGVGAAGLITIIAHWQ